jgi:HupE / UreJ protein
MGRSAVSWLHWFFRKLAGLLCVGLLLMGGGTLAHPAPNSSVMIDIGQASVSVELSIPKSELESALSPEFGTDARKLIETHAAPLYAYIVRHVGAQSVSGMTWSSEINSMTSALLGEHESIVARLTLTPPAGSGTRLFDLEFSGVTHEVRSHVAVVMLRSDFFAGKLGHDPTFIASLQHPVRSVRIDAGQAATLSAGINAAFWMGLHHIARGTDLLFLLMLVLPGALVAGRRKWILGTEWHQPCMRMLWTITAFSLGHGTTLILGIGFNWSFPGALVELLVALSILLTAMHAWRPIFGGHDVLLGGVFGLVHGMAFSSAIDAYALEPLARFALLAGFTIGIEMLQLLLVALALPVTIMLSAKPHYRWIRPTLCLLGAVPAIDWTIERWPDAASMTLNIASGLNVGPHLVALLIVVLFCMVIIAKTAIRRWRRPQN